MLCLGCSRHEAPPAREGPKKPLVDITVWIDRTPEGDPETTVAISTKTPPRAREMLQRSGFQMAIVGVPADADLQAFLEKEVPEVEAAGSIATLVVSTRCLADFVPILQKKISLYWRVALVVGAPCEAKTKSALGTAILVEAGKISQVRMTFDRHMGAFLKVEPIP